MRLFAVVVRNELTGETMQFSLNCGHPCEAQVQALTTAFRQHGWRKVVAFLPQAV